MRGGSGRPLTAHAALSNKSAIKAAWLPTRRERRVAPRAFKLSFSTVFLHRCILSDAALSLPSFFYLLSFDRATLWCSHSYSRSLVARGGKAGARFSNRVRRAREKMTPARDLSLCHVISPSFQWVGLRLFVRLAEPTGSARPARRGRQRCWTIARNEHARWPTPWHVVFR
jgi:hypothetical protein